MEEYTVRVDIDCDVCGDDEFNRIADETPDPAAIAKLIAQILPAGCAHAALTVTVSDSTEDATERASAS